MKSSPFDSTYRSGPVDSAASVNTVSVLARVNALQASGGIGSATWAYTSSTADAPFTSATGKQPLIKGWGYFPSSSNPTAYTTQTARLKTHWNAGGIVAITPTITNFATGRSLYDRSKTDFSAVTSIKKGGANYSLWTAFLDDLATFLTTDLVDSSGVPIPCIIRPFHEINGFFDFSDLTISSMTTDGSTVTVQTSTAHGVVAGNFVQIVGATPAIMNGAQFVTGAADTTHFTFSALGAITAPGTTCYLCSGFYWAGRDRQADLMVVFREMVDYMRTTKGVHNILWMWNIYPYDGVNYNSTNPSSSDAYGSYAYPGWYPNDGYIDIVGLDYYDRRSNVALVTMTGATLLSTYQIIKGIANSQKKPNGFIEMGFDHAGREKAGFWTTDVLTPMKSSSMGCLLGLWDSSYIPISSDAAYASFQTAMADSVMKHLGQA